MNYILNEHNDVRIDGELIISNENLLRAINFCNDAIRTLDEQTKQFDINIFEVLGMRNMSGDGRRIFCKKRRKIFVWELTFKPASGWIP